MSPATAAPAEPVSEFGALDVRVITSLQLDIGNDALADLTFSFLTSIDRRLGPPINLPGGLLIQVAEGLDGIAVRSDGAKLGSVRVQVGVLTSGHVGPKGEIRLTPDGRMLLGDPLRALAVITSADLSETRVNVGVGDRLQFDLGEFDLVDVGDRVVLDYSFLQLPAPDDPTTEAGLSAMDALVWRWSLGRIQALGVDVAGDLAPARVRDVTGVIVEGSRRVDMSAAAPEYFGSAAGRATAGAGPGFVSGSVVPDVGLVAGTTSDFLIGTVPAILQGRVRILEDNEPAPTAPAAPAPTPRPQRPPSLTVVTARGACDSDFGRADVLIISVAPIDRIEPNSLRYDVNPGPQSGGFQIQANEPRDKPDAASQFLSLLNPTDEPIDVTIDVTVVGANGMRAVERQSITIPPRCPRVETIDADALDCMTGAPLSNPIYGPQLVARHAELTMDPGRGLKLFAFEFLAIEDLKEYLEAGHPPPVGGFGVTDPNAPLPPPDPNWFLNGASNTSFNFTYNAETGEFEGSMADARDGSWKQVPDVTFPVRIQDGNRLVMEVPMELVPEGSRWYASLTDFSTCIAFGLEGNQAGQPLPGEDTPAPEAPDGFRPIAPGATAVQ